MMETPLAVAVACAAVAVADVDKASEELTPISPGGAAMAVLFVQSNVASAAAPDAAEYAAAVQRAA